MRKRQTEIQQFLARTKEINGQEAPSRTSSQDQKNSEQEQWIPLSEIYVKPDQFRKYFHPETIAELKTSIENNGFIGAILVRHLPEKIAKQVDKQYKYELVCGETRYRAMQELNRKTIPATIRQLTDKQSRRLALDENIIRKDLNPLEEHEALLEVIADEIDISTKEVISVIDHHKNAVDRNQELSDGAVTQFSKIKNLLSDYDKGSPEGFLNTLRRLRNLPPDLMAALPDIEYSKLIELKPVKDEKRRENLLKWINERNPTLLEIRKKKKEMLQKKIAANENSRFTRARTILQAISVSKDLDNHPKGQEIDAILDQLQQLLQI